MEWVRPDIVPLLISRGFPLGKDRVYSAYVSKVMPYGSETWPVKEEDVIRLERDNARIVTLMCKVWPEGRISTEELKIE